MRKGKVEWYEKTEALLYNYKAFPVRIMSMRQQLEELQEELLPSITCSYEFISGSASGSMSSPVEKAVLRRLEDEKVLKLSQNIKWLESIKEIIERSINTVLDDEQKELIKLAYFQQEPCQQICLKLYIERSTYFNRKNKAIKKLAWCFGYMSDDEADETLGLNINQILK